MTGTMPSESALEATPQWNRALLRHGSSARMAEVAPGEAALVLTSPPYFPPALADELAQGPDAQADLHSLEHAIRAFAWSFRPVFDECMRVLRPGGRLVMQTRDVRLRQVLVPVESIHRQLAEAAGLQTYARHAWRAQQVTLPRRRMTAALGSALGPMPVEPDAFLVMRKPGDVWLGEPTLADAALLTQDVMVTPTGKLPARHAHQAPICILQAMIRTYSRPGDLVVDPFAGGGTSLRCAVELGRRAVGYDVDEGALSLARINLAH
jgi:hypothetical protein